uniref:Uncharacterized protein n=1 Tax=Cacopsylla melanoneura TaxID=428564 RepID=A0A8D9BKY1_9HEMI
MFKYLDETCFQALSLSLNFYYFLIFISSYSHRFLSSLFLLIPQYLYLFLFPLSHYFLLIPITFSSLFLLIPITSSLISIQSVPSTHFSSDIILRGILSKTR